MEKEASIIVVACKIFLVSLFIFSAGSQVLDNGKKKKAEMIFREVEGVAFRRKKSLRSLGSENKNTTEAAVPPQRPKEKRRRCADGKYWHVGGCIMCSPCRDAEVMVEECRNDRNRVCVCRQGYFEIARIGRDFDCKECINCSALHKQTLQACHKNGDAQCGPCLFGFCEFEQTCQLCPIEGVQDSTRASVSSTTRIESMDLQQASLAPRIPDVRQCDTTCKIAIGACGCVLLLWGVLLLLYKKKAISAQSKSLHTPNFYTARPHLGSPVASLPEMATWVDTGPAHHCSLQQGRKLYVIINAVPVRRWKEFVRGLGLRDSEIELVELEHSQFREQQYEMLKCWFQRRHASVSAVLSTLEAMQLGGCAQELREQLQAEDVQGDP